MELFALAMVGAFISGTPLAGLAILPDGTLLEEIALGAGPVARDNHIASLHLVVQVDGGKELVNTDRRGLPYTIRFGDTEEAHLQRLTLGMKPGGWRRAYLPPGAIANELLPKDNPLIVQVRLIELSRP